VRCTGRGERETTETVSVRANKGILCLLHACLCFIGGVETWVWGLPMSDSEVRDSALEGDIGIINQEFPVTPN